MNERKLRRFCLALIAFSICIRALSAMGAAALLDEKLLASGILPHWLSNGKADKQEEEKLWVVQLGGAPAAVKSSQKETAEAAQTEPAAQDPDAQHAPPDALDSDASAPQTPPAQQEEQAPPQPLVFTDEEADAITIAGACTYTVDKRALLQQPSQLTLSQDDPTVLIVHTHSCEAYTIEPGWEYESSDRLRTTDAARSVIRVGDEIAAALNARGIETLHDTALNDYPSYSGAYARMETTISRYLEEYPSIQMVIDVHRDAADDADGNPVCFSADVSGERCAQLMLVVGTDEGGLTHPDWEENLANALKLQVLLNRKAPGLCRDLDLRTERFNQHLTKGSLLCEFGSTGNTLQEAIRSGRLFAEALAELLQGV